MVVLWIILILIFAIPIWGSLLFLWIKKKRKKSDGLPWGQDWGSKSNGPSDIETPPGST